MEKHSVTQRETGESGREGGKGRCNDVFDIIMQIQHFQKDVFIYFKQQPFVPCLISRFLWSFDP